MSRVAIYARYSTDMQSNASIDDQIRLCEQRLEREGWKGVNCYSDHAMSGASLMRPGIQMLMQDAQAQKFDIVLAEALDRLSRDQEDIAALFKRLSFAGVKIFTLAEGEISHLHIGLKGTMNALFLKDLADKTRRGLRGKIESGKSGGGLTYGYDVVRKVDAAGELVRGERTVNEGEAQIVRRIFREYLTGKSPKAMAHTLNKEGIPGPQGREWGCSTIYGNRQRGTGILNNELYVGRLIWNRLRYIKDPETGKRVSRLNPEDEWVINEVPELRIVDQDLWDRVKGKQGEINKPDKPFWAKQRPRNLFSSLIKCGGCGGGVSLVSQTHLGCSTARNKGTCDNRMTLKRERLEEDVLGALRERLMDPELCAIFCKQYTEHLNNLRKTALQQQAAYEHELAQLEKERKKLVQSILDGVPGDVLKDDANRINDRMNELKELLAETEQPRPALHPSMAEHYHHEVSRLIETLNNPEHRAEASQLIRTLVESIVVTPDEKNERLVVDLKGDLAGILAVAQNKAPGAAMGDRALDKVKLVAGVGFEPTTFRL